MRVQAGSSTAARLVIVVLLVLGAIGAGSHPATAGTPDDERTLYLLTNDARASAGLGRLQYDPAASDVARNWSVSMASRRSLQHNPNLAGDVDTYVTSQWTRLGENVGYGYDAAGLHNAFMNSAPHRANVLGDFNRVGVGAYHDGSNLWVTLVFVKGPSIPEYALPGAPRVAFWFFHQYPSPGLPDGSIAYGVAGDQVLVCDWNGDGVDTVAVYRSGNWYIRNSNTPGPPNLTINYGAAGYQAVCGDWDGNGADSIGVYAGGYWYLRDSNSSGPPSRVAHYGAPGYRPVVGDWNGDRTDGIGVYVNGSWYLRETASDGPPARAFAYGAPGYLPVVGDWEGDGADGIAVFVNGVWHLRGVAGPGVPGFTFAYGAPGWVPLAGDWNADGAAGITVVGT